MVSNLALAEKKRKENQERYAQIIHPCYAVWNSRKTPNSLEEIFLPGITVKERKRKTASLTDRASSMPSAPSSLAGRFTTTCWGL